MYDQSRVAVVVPAYNEEGLVGTVLRTIPEFVDYVYAIDDCSTDGTWDEIKRYSTHVRPDPTAELPDVDAVTDAGPVIVALRQAENRGRGHSIKTGYRMALRDGADVVAVMDGDGQMDPDELDRIIEPILKGRADYTKGTRLQDGDHVADMSNWRLFGNVLLSVITNFSSGYWGLLDSQNGYTAISRTALEGIPIDELYDGYGFLNDILTMLNVGGFRIAEVPHPAVYDDEESGIEYSSFVPAVSLLLLRNFFHRLRMQYVAEEVHVTAVCYGIGFLVLLFGVANGIGALLTAGRLLFAEFAVPLLVLGLVLCLVGVVLDIQYNAGRAYQSDPRPEPSQQ
jgi:glycosyltransferase involved in cell wall biosynthesis